MKEPLAELIRLISSGCMSEEEIYRLADEAAQAYADPQAFLQANSDIIYDDDFPIPLGEWMIIGSLPDTVLFQADDYQALFEQIVGWAWTFSLSDAFPGVPQRTPRSSYEHAHALITSGRLFSRKEESKNEDILRVATRAPERNYEESSEETLRSSEDLGGVL